MEQTILHGFIRKTKHPSWLSAFLTYYIVQRIISIKDVKKKKKSYFYNQFSKYRKFDKTITKSG